MNFRYKPDRPGLEGVAWFCADCGAEVHRQVWDTAETVSQEAYLAACRGFNDNPATRTCPDCGSVHSEIDLTPFRWQEVADEIRADTAR